jgi:hypothetical protein
MAVYCRASSVIKSVRARGIGLPYQNKHNTEATHKDALLPWGKPVSALLCSAPRYLGPDLELRRPDGRNEHHGDEHQWTTEAGRTTLVSFAGCTRFLYTELCAEVRRIEVDHKTADTYVQNLTKFFTTYRISTELRPCSFILMHGMHPGIVKYSARLGPLRAALYAAIVGHFRILISEAAAPRLTSSAGLLNVRETELEVLLRETEKTCERVELEMVLDSLRNELRQAEVTFGQQEAEASRKRVQQALTRKLGDQVGPVGATLCTDDSAFILRTMSAPPLVDMQRLLG